MKLSNNQQKEKKKNNDNNDDCDDINIDDGGYDSLIFNQMK